jgi:hypothetical protein
MRIIISRSVSPSSTANTSARGVASYQASLRVVARLAVAARLAAVPVVGDRAEQRLLATGHEGEADPPQADHIVLGQEDVTGSPPEAAAAAGTAGPAVERVGAHSPPLLPRDLFPPAALPCGGAGGEGHQADGTNVLLTWCMGFLPRAGAVPGQ